MATYEGKIVGLATMVKNQENNQLRSIYVLPEFQGRGVGYKLWDEIKGFTDKNKKTIVHVASYNKKAIAFYEKIGFVHTGKFFKEDRFKMKSGAVIPETEMVLSDI